MEELFDGTPLLGSVVLDLESGDVFNEDNKIDALRKKALKRYGKLEQDMFYFEMFSFELWTNDIGESQVVYWMAAEHPIAKILENRGILPLSHTGKKCKYGDVVVHDKRDIDLCIDMIINKE